MDINKKAFIKKNTKNVLFNKGLFKHKKKDRSRTYNYINYTNTSSIVPVPLAAAFAPDDVETATAESIS